MKPLIRRIRWVRITCILCGLLAAGTVGYGCYKDSIAYGAGVISDQRGRRRYPLGSCRQGGHG